MSTKEFRLETIIDAFTKTLPVLHEEHILVHEGKIWCAYYHDTKDTDELLEILLITPNTRSLFHTLFSFEAVLSGRFAIYEDTERTYVSGNAITPLNRFRSYTGSVPVGLQICHTPGGSGLTGTQIGSGLIGGGLGKQSVGGSKRDDSEYVLKPNTAYLLVLRSDNDSNFVQIHADWYDRFHSQIPTTTTTTTTT